MAAVVQRSVSGDFRFKAGGFELPGLFQREIEVTEAALTELKELIYRVDEEHLGRIQDLFSLVDALRAAVEAEMGHLAGEVENRQQAGLDQVVQQIEIYSQRTDRELDDLRQRVDSLGSS